MNGATPTCTFLAALILTSCVTADTPPRLKVELPVALSGSIQRKKIKAGTPLIDDPMLGSLYLAKLPTTKLYGRWSAPSFISYADAGTYYGAAKHRGWSIELQRGISSKVLKAIQNAKDGYDADLGETVNASARIYPRFVRKHFNWGEGVSFLVQYQNDNTNYVPNNGMLLYEVHGITSDHRFTVHAQFGVTHPQLAVFGPEVRDYPEGADKPDWPMLRDRDYIRVETCPDDAFQPSLKEIDAVLNTLRPDV